MSSPMKAPQLHDELVLLDGGKRWPVPGASLVKVTLSANVDSQQAPGAGTAVSQLNEAAAEVEVEVTMWTSEQWDAYGHLLSHLRRGTSEGPAVFTTAHPEVTARRVKRLYFVSESSAGYNPRAGGYKATLRFSEKLKEQSTVTAVGGEAITVPPATGGGGGTTPTGGTSAGTAQGQAVYEAAVKAMGSPPAPADGGRATTATPGYCSASVRVVGTAAGLSPSLFGASAIATEGAFKRAGLSEPWGPSSMSNVQNGDIVFWGRDPSGYGHAGVVVGRDKDGMPLIYGNNLKTYADKGGRFDAGGRPIDRHIDSRGVVRMDQLSSRTSQPTSVGKPGGVPRTTRPPTPGPPAPLPPNRPSQNVPRPPGR